MATSDTRYLLGPELLLGLCAHRPHALAWADQVAAQHCFISNLAIALVQSVIDVGETDAEKRDDWLKAVDQVKSRYVAEGGNVIDVTSDVLVKWRHWRLRSPLQFQGDDGLEDVEQDVRLLLASAQALALTFVEYDSPYLHQAKDRQLAVQIIEKET